MLFQNRVEPDKAKMWRWISYFLIGIITGILAFVMEIGEEYMVDFRNYIVDVIIDNIDDTGLA